jgi:small subunit ribosomal protein S21
LKTRRIRRGTFQSPYLWPTREEQNLQILVRDNNVDQALKVLKKKMQREGIFREMKRRRFYEKPSERNARQKGEAVRRARKLARKKAVYEGLIADPRKKKVAAGRGFTRN